VAVLRDRRVEERHELVAAAPLIRVVEPDPEAVPSDQPPLPALPPQERLALTEEDGDRAFVAREDNRGALVADHQDLGVPSALEPPAPAVKPPPLHTVGGDLVDSSSSVGLTFASAATSASIASSGSCSGSSCTSGQMSTNASSGVQRS
jgi:hypothetical protein